MPAHTVNTEEQLSCIVAVRLTAKDLKRLHKTLRKYGITQGSMSDKMRAFFKEAYLRSIRISSNHVTVPVRVQEKPTVIEDSEEQRAYEEWFNNLGSHSDEEPL